ncbi:hypothetical protein ENUP19_0093G0046 [Entamoeba nuttalli]|uniref:Uncharacterized protein n=2 Tax=Entamoeba nuttalli TaxID=412467 RepID=K2G7K3_ENTNP|nr:hypothetical protein ENU1_167360 [Entamoeba nuttalli P19]EKE38411.1 hypothetical protein ENU1_167360 [Entamoeba nuttalli P19]|eukprot:XP_008859254.1 hypothetical protein ENU1_167360 [Entamoeba nuttalli P19]
MSGFNRPRDDIFETVAAMDLADVYKDAQCDPNVNPFIKRIYYLMKEPQYLEWKLNNDPNVVDDDAREDILRRKLESIKRCERISQFLDEQNIGLNTYSVWLRKFKKNSTKLNNVISLPDWVRKHSNKCKDDIDADKIIGAGCLTDNDNPDEMKSRRAMTKGPKKDATEKKPKKPESKE